MLDLLAVGALIGLLFFCVIIVRTLTQISNDLYSIRAALSEINDRGLEDQSIAVIADELTTVRASIQSIEICYREDRTNYYSRR